jgi:hypothetical protein
MYQATARGTASSAKAVFPQVVMCDTHYSSYVNNLIFNLRAHFMNSPKPVSFESGIVSIMLLNCSLIIVSTSIRLFLREISWLAAKTGQLLKMDSAPWNK